MPASPLGTCLALPGAGIGPTIRIGEETVITVDTKAAGKGKVTCTVCTPDGSEVDVDVVENEDGTFDIFYTAPQPGKYVICVRFGGEHVPNSPFQVTVRRAGEGVGGLSTGAAQPVSQGPSVTTDSLALAPPHRLWLGTSPWHSPRCGLSSWPHSTPMPRVASRPGYGPACPARGDAVGWPAGRPMGHLQGGTPVPYLPGHAVSIPTAGP